MAKPTIQEKISNLQDLANRAGTRAEAEVAAGKISVLLLRHNLTLADIATYQKAALTERDITVQSVDWQGTLAATVARAHLCAAIGSVQEGLPTIFRFIGREDNVSVAVKIYEWLQERIFTVTETALTAAQAENDWYAFLDPLGWRQGFQYGMVDGINEAYARSRRELSFSESMALVPFMGEVEEHLEKTYPDLTRAPIADEIDARAYRAGFKAGLATPTTTQLEDADERALQGAGTAGEDQPRPHPARMATERDNR